MKNQNIKLIAFVSLCLGISQLAVAQTTSQKIGNNPTIKEASAVLELESSNKGFLTPRLALTSLNVSGPITAPADALTVFNTATAGIGVNAVTPGYYYWRKDLVTPANSKWVRLIDDPTTLVVEPWNVQNTTTKATLNADPIYQNGKVAIGNFGTSISTKQMEVKGNFKAEVSDAGASYGTEIDNPLIPGTQKANHYWLSNAFTYRVNGVHSNAAFLTAGTEGTNPNSGIESIVAADDIRVTMGSRMKNGSSKSEIRTDNTGNFYMESYNQGNNYGSTFSLQNDGLRLRHTNTNGAADPFPLNNDSEIFLKKAEGVRFTFSNSSGLDPQSYWFPITKGAAGQVMTQTGSGKIIWSTPAAAAAATEPWFKILSPGTQATSNAEGIYQTGAVAIGTSSAPSFTIGSGPTLQ
ncbi:MAG: hypothetical protein EOO92_21705, partial [Pedobacter sp.]